MSTDKPLTPRQQRFVEEYLIDLNATQAATRAGYSAKTANEQGARLLAHASVAAAIRAGQAALSERTGVTAEYVERRTVELLERCMQNEPVMRNGLPVREMTPDGELAAVYEFDATGAARALEILAKRVGFYAADNAQRSGNGLAALPAGEREAILERLNAARSSRVGGQPEPAGPGRTTH